MKVFSYRLMRVALVSALLFTITACGDNADDQQNLAGMAVPVLVTLVKQENIPDKARVFGNLYAPNDTSIASEIAGNIASIDFKEGDLVQAGTELIRIDARTQAARLEQAQADAQLSQIELERAKNLFQKGAQSRQEYDKATVTDKVRMADVAIAQADFDKTLILAPFSGRLGARTISLGAYVSPGTPLVTIVDKQHLKIRYHLPEKQVSQLQVNQIVALQVDAFPEETFSGTVDFVAPTVDVSSHTILVEAQIPNPKERLSPGLSAVVLQTLGTIPDALILPEETLVASIEGQSVYRLYTDEKTQQLRVQKVLVDVGARHDGVVQIISGLKVGDQIVLQGQQKLRDGANVQIFDPAKAKPKD